MLIEEFQDYEYELDDEFIIAIGKRLYNKMKNAKSTNQLVSIVVDAGFVLDAQTESGWRKHLFFSKEKNRMVELLVINTTERWLDGKKYYWFDSARYSWHREESNYET